MKSLKSNEVRRGNIVNIDADGQPTYYRLLSHDIGAIDNNGFVVYPVPLSPDLLEKCGFVKNGFGDYNMDISLFEKEYKILSFSNDYLYLIQGELDNHRSKDDLCVLWNKDKMKCFYLHQLQNLVYALTQTELNVEL